MSASGTRVEAPPSVEIEAFANGAEHLLAELERLRFIVHAEVHRLRAANLLTENQFRGLYIADEQIDAILDAAPPDVAASNNASAGRREIRALELLALRREESIMARSEASRAAGVVLPLERLTALYSLSRFERDTLLLSVAPEIDATFETLYSYAQNDVTRKRPTVGLVLRLLAANPEERLDARSYFSPSGSLFEGPLVRFCDETQDREGALLSRTFRPEERIVNFLFDCDDLDSRLRAFTCCVTSTRRLASLHLPSHLAKALYCAANAVHEDGGILFFHGSAGTGKRAAAEALTAEAGRKLIVADIPQAQSAGAPASPTLALLRREARLSGANLLLVHAEAWLRKDDEHRQPPTSCSRSFFGSIAGSDSTYFVTSDALLPVAENAACAWSSFEFSTPGFLDRKRLWQEGFDSIAANPSQDAAAALANRFVLTGGQILRACRAARTHALFRGQDPSTLAADDFDAEARAQSNHDLKRCAQKIESFCDWPQLVLPTRTVRQLREVCAAAKYRSTVYVDWGFDRRLMHGKGLIILFCGPSGTGKTMSAGIVARELKLDLYKIDISTVVSKYIGETEKQLSQIFREAQSSNAILFFDEADAIFGKRSEVKDAHDRYANIEVAYLLQKMEEYEGIVILCTNFRKNIDDAFTRRIHYVVEFPFPEPEYRERIWRNIIPASAPLAGDVDFGFLARQFELAGGNIRNAALVAAFYAAEDGGMIRMKHCVLAVARELQKMGKLPSRSDFREYYEFTRERE
jgi:ATPase family associated with various cellular activities (AAA)